MFVHLKERKAGSRKRDWKCQVANAFMLQTVVQEAGVNQEREDGLCEGGFAVKRRNREVGSVPGAALRTGSGLGESAGP